MTDVLIKRELLERIDETAICDGTDVTISDDLFTQLVEALAVARQPEREGLEVVAWLGGNGFHTEEKEATGAPFPLCHLSDALRQQQRIADDFIVELDLANARNMTLRTDLAAARLQTAMMVVCAKNLADERDALLATIELMQSKQELNVIGDV